MDAHLGPRYACCRIRVRGHDSCMNALTCVFHVNFARVRYCIHKLALRAISSKSLGAIERLHSCTRVMAATFQERLIELVRNYQHLCDHTSPLHFEILFKMLHYKRGVLLIDVHCTLSVEEPCRLRP